MVSSPLLRRAALLLLLGAAPLPAAAVEPLDAAAKKEITAGEARAVEGMLAGPKFHGRGTGQKGNGEAAKWLAAELRKAGIAPAVVRDRVENGKTVEGDYLQPFDVPAARVGPGGNTGTCNVVGFLEGTGAAWKPPAPATTPPAGSESPPPVPASPPPDVHPPAEGSPPAPPPKEEPPPSAAPERAMEYVVLGAHFDHLGIRGGEPKPGKTVKRSGVFWGADDNASGTTAALLVARTLGRLAKEGVRPRRTIVVCFFSAEEIGLLGSKHYVDHPVFPLADTVAMVNLDMVGRNATKHLEVFGNTSSPEIDAWHREVLETTGFDCVYPPPDLLQRSDQWNFLQAGIPVLMLFGGFHKDYHTNRDTPDLINYPKVALIARHGLGVLWKAANAEKRPQFRKVDMSGAGGKLGIAVEPCTPEEEDPLNLAENATAVRVATVFAGSLGEKFFQPGDLITSWGGYPILDDDPVGRFTGHVGTARPGDTVVIRFVRGKEKKAVSVKL